MGIPTIIIAATLEVLAPGTTESVDVRVTGSGDAATVAHVEQAARSVIADLPEGFFLGLLHDDVLQIKIENLNDSLDADDFCSFGDKTFGSYDRKRKRIVVSEKLVRLAVQSSNAGPPDFDCNHRTFSRTLRATIVHELAHAYDAVHRVSRRDSFRKLAGGEARYRFLRKNHVGNYNYASSPDPYEFKSLKEALAVNFEYYVLDSGFRCARPAYASFFDEEFESAEAPECDEHKSVLLHSNIIGDNLARVASLDPEDVYEIHYLFAFKGNSIASKWGHGMFRLVTCAPYREVVDEACLNDAANHLVLSYRANVADITINYVKGLLGAYPSQLFVYELPEIIKEYTRLEFRDLISIPLTLTPHEKERFLDVALERYWNYEGKYFFITNHCGTEALNHLRASGDGLADGVSSRTPRRLLKTLPRADLVDEELYSAVVGADSASTHFFPSKRPHYQAAFDGARRYGMFGGLSLDAFLETSKAADRSGEYKLLLESSMYRGTPNDGKRTLVMGLVLLERLLQAHEQDRIANEAMRILLKNDAGVVDSLRIAIVELYDEPWNLVDDAGYGVPSRSSIETYLADDSRRQDQSDLYALLKSHDLLSGIIDQLDRLSEIELLLEGELVQLSAAPVVAGG